MTTDNSTFPAPAYKDTVLAPLFDATKTAFWGELMRINQAHAVMLAEQGICSDAEIGAILNALSDIVAAIDPGDMVYTGDVEDLFFEVEKRLGAALGVDLAGKLHTGRSRNDIDHTIFKMKLRRQLASLRATLHDLIATILDVADANRDTIIVAYTHGQPAQPSTFGHYLGAVIEILLRDDARLAAAGRDLDRCSMGAAAITTTGFDISRERVAELLGFAAVQENSYGCIAACDYITATYAALKVMFINIGRVVQDLNAWTGFEVGQLHVPDAFVQISSIMPQKRNPVPVEHLRLIASLAAGHCDTISDTMRNTPFTDMNDSESEVQIAGYPAFATGQRLLRLLAAFLSAVRIDQDQVRHHIDTACIAITELADTLVRNDAISFRQAHEVAAAVARQVVGTDGKMSTVPFADFAAAYAKAIGRPTTLTETEFRRVTTPEYFVAVRERLGGPGPTALATSLDGYREQLAAARAGLTQALSDLSAADDLLAARVAHYRAAAQAA